MVTSGEFIGMVANAVVTIVVWEGMKYLLRHLSWR